MAGISFFVGVVVLVRYVIQMFEVPFPTSIASMLIVFSLLIIFNRIPDFLNSGASRLFRIFPLLFVPPLVLVVEVIDVFISHVVVLVFAFTVSSLIGILVTAKVAQLFIRRGPADNA